MLLLGNEAKFSVCSYYVQKRRVPGILAVTQVIHLSPYCKCDHTLLQCNEKRALNNSTHNKRAHDLLSENGRRVVDDECRTEILLHSTHVSVVSIFS